MGGAELAHVPGHASGGTTLPAQTALTLSWALQALKDESSAQA